LKQNDKVKVTIMFRGREVAHPERGEALLMKLADELSELGTVEQSPNQEGRNMTMMLAPVRAPSNSGKRPDSEAAATETQTAQGAATKTPAAEADSAETPAAEAAQSETQTAEAAESGQP
jgi:translation initiation factor IF-3